MNQQRYTIIAVFSGGAEKEISITAESEASAYAAAMRHLTPGQCDNLESLDCVEVEPA